jgi:hypothetical protein
MTLRTPARLGYRQRLLLLVGVALILGTLLLRKKVGPTWQRWRECRQLEADEHAGTDIHANKQRLEEKLHEMTLRFGGDKPANDRWREVISRIGSGTGPDTPTLITLSAEHVESIGENTVHTLPVVVQGSTESLLRLADALGSRTDGVHLASLYIHATRPRRDEPRYVQATLYLRTIAP